MISTGDLTDDNLCKWVDYQSLFGKGAHAPPLREEHRLDSRKRQKSILGSSSSSEIGKSASRSV